MSNIREKIINEVIDIEGGYVNDECDSGGETRFGITKYTARSCGYGGDMKNLPKEQAYRIYIDRYWNPMRLDQIAALSGGVAKEMFDSGVNCGVSRASEWLQRALNVLNREGKDYADIAVDGEIGRKTIAAYEALVERRGKQGLLALYKILNGLQVAHYVTLAERRAKDEKFLFGWITTRT